MSQPQEPRPRPAAAGPDPLLGRVINDRYRIVEQIGQGGMGRVYKAVQSPLDRVVALKVLGAGYDRDANFSRRFFLEASVTAKLTHPNTIGVYDFGSTPDGIYYLAMEYLKGRTLSEAMQREGPLAQERVIHIAQQVCRSLREAHGLGIIHRDLKPSNVMLLSQHDDHDFVKVLDFGLVKFFAGDGPDQEITNQGTFVGSPHYMAPEQARQQRPDQRCDVYSLGVVLYQMLTGSPPFEAESSVDLILKHVLDAPPRPREQRPDLNIAPALEEIVLRCLAKQREERYGSMEELLTQLKAVRAQVSGIVTPPSSPPFPAPRTAMRPTPHPEMRTPSQPMLSMPPPPPPDAFEDVPAGSTREWIEWFRALHQRAQAGVLTAEEAARYEREREALSTALLTAQTQATQPGKRQRHSLRLEKGLQVILQLGPDPLTTKTLDLTLGGFAVLLLRPLRAGESVPFTLALRSGPVSGKARVVNVQRKGRPYRVGMIFEGLGSADATRISLEILDGLLGRMQPSPLRKH